MPELALSEFADKMAEIIPVLGSELMRRQTNELFKGEITLQQFAIIDYLNRNGQSRMTDLAHFLKVSTAAMTGIIERLVKAGYALRLSEPGDRRIIKISALPKGIELVKKLNRQRREMIMDIFGQLSSVEREDYLRILTRVRDIMLKNKKTEQKNEKK
jgi:DNA-binding MarR family transcriptional regulator